MGFRARAVPWLVCFGFLGATQRSLAQGESLEQAQRSRRYRFQANDISRKKLFICCDADELTRFS
jgi:hypothetical protein